MPTRYGTDRVEDTIVAIATPAGKSAIGIVRVSGSTAHSIVSRFFVSPGTLKHRTAVLGRWVANGQELDEVVATAFDAPHSYTGENLVEIGAHGNPLILGRILQTLQAAGARVADPGEFTLRAVLNGKMDLLQAEAVRDFINAQTDGQARAALQQMEGSLSKCLRPIKERLIEIVARTEAGIDFVEDELEVPDATAAAAVAKELGRDLDVLAATYEYGRLLNAGLRIAIVGKPNVGKSSLFNRLVSINRAIVTEIPGTTRDVLAETISLEGVPLKFLDTAGIRETDDRVEKLGIERSREALADADLAIAVIDGSRPIEEDDRRVLSLIGELPCIVALNKGDVGDAVALNSFPKFPAVRTSAATGAGIEDLRVKLREFVLRTAVDSSVDGILTNARQHEAIVRAATSLRMGANALMEGVPHEMALLDLYEALNALNELTGEFGTEDLLGRIFSTFCIGK